MRLIRKNNIYKGLSFMCFAYCVYLCFMALYAYTQDKFFTWPMVKDYMWLFCITVLLYFFSLPFVDYYLKRMQEPDI